MRVKSGVCIPRFRIFCNRCVLQKLMVYRGTKFNCVLSCIRFESANSIGEHMPEIPHSLDDITPDWLSANLADRPIIHSFSKEVIGEGAGFLGDIVRIRPQPESLASLVVKMPTATTNNRRIGQLLGVYEREVRFYKELRPYLSIRTPKLLHGDMDDSDPTRSLRDLRLMKRLPIWLVKLLLPLVSKLAGNVNQRYVLLLEDLGGYRMGDQLNSVTHEDSMLAVKTLASLHAGFFDRSLTAFPWVIPFDLGARYFQIVTEKNHEEFCIRHQHILPDSHKEILNWLIANAGLFVGRMAQLPYTLLHGDYRLDNLSFDDERGEIIVMDWQTLLQGPIGIDLSYYIASTDVDGSEHELLEYYRGMMSEAGIEISSARVRYEYEMGVIASLQRIMLLASDDFHFGEGRGPELLERTTIRFFEAAEKIELDALLRGVPG